MAQKRPIIALIGRPNVGKSTLFNRIIGKNKAIVAPMPAVTRDRIYAEIEWENTPITIVDTGGLLPLKEEMPILGQVIIQSQKAINEADVVIFITDVQTGLTPIDKELMQYLREVEKPLLIAVNKVDSERQAKDIYDFYELGIKRIFPISALHGHGIYELMEEVLCLIPIEKKQVSKDGQERILIKVAIVGRPNVGKSFLFNRLIGDERSVVSDMPGTTRDSIDTVLEYADKTYLFMDTAGLRRKSHIKTTLEKYSVKRALRTIEGTDIVLLLTEAPGGVTNQDLIILNYAKEYAKCILMVINKWDLMPKTPSFKKEYIESIKKRLNFARFLPIVTVSALKGQGVKQIFPLLNLLYQEYNQRISTGRLNRFMRDTLGKYPPPLYQNRPIKLYYITQINVKPPSFVVFTNYPQGVPKQYKRFLINQLAQLGFTHIPLRVFFRERRK